VKRPSTSPGTAPARSPSPSATANQQELNGALPLRHHVYNAPGTYSITAIATGTCQGRARRDLDVR